MKKVGKGEGLKYDIGKDEWSLLPFEVIREVVKVLTFGAKKYKPQNWKKVKNLKKRYFNALLRHIVAWKEDKELYDDETGLHHLSHALCCLIFVFWKEIQDLKKSNIVIRRTDDTISKRRNRKK